MSLFWGWAIIIVILTSLPANPEIIKQKEDLIIRLDYLEHIFFFTIQSFLFFLAYKLNPGKKVIIKPVLWLIAGILFASITEIYQFYIPGRAYNPVDLALNVSGLLLGIPAGRWFVGQIPEHKS